MNIQLSRTKIDSFLGSEVCLRLCADTPLTEADVQWRAASDILRIRDFRNAGEFSLNDGMIEKAYTFVFENEDKLQSVLDSMYFYRMTKERITVNQISAFTVV